MLNRNPSRSSLSVLSLVVALFLSGHLYAAPGDLDETFGDRGRAFAPINLHPSRVRTQADGKIVTFSSDTWEYFHANSAIARHNANGTLDQSFGQNGVIKWYGYCLYDFVVLDDGKLLAVGESLVVGEEGFAIFRMNSNGSRDTDFGSKGVIITRVASSSLSAGLGIALQPDGKVIVLGFGTFSAVSPPVMVRYQGDGSLDTSFGEDGVLVLAKLRSTGHPGGIFVLPDGKFLVSVMALNLTELIIARYNPNGTPDESFGTNGKVSTGISNGVGLEVQGDGKFIVNGHGSLLKRYNPDGTPDTLFGANGVVSFPGRVFRELAVQGNGKIVTAGAQDGGYAISRYDPNGSIDSTFGDNGLVITRLDNSNQNNRISALTFQPDGNIVAAGYFWSGSAGFNALFRYVSEPLDRRISVSGAVKTPDGRGIPNITVLITKAMGEREKVTTSSLGFYSFESLAPGGIYTLLPLSKKYRFEPRTLKVDASLTNEDFVGGI